jgi:hypothetical protein
MKRTPNILTREVLAKIPAMVASGEYANRQAIADALGCKLTTLTVRCSQSGISLRVAGGKRRGPEPYTIVRLDQNVADKLNAYAAKSGMTGQALARRLIETIAQDDLYAAVLDDKVAA